jgi:epsilon-lactone hydrolase
LFIAIKIAGVLLVLAILAAIAAILSARRSGISVRAWLLLGLVPFLAPNFNKPGAMERAIARDRAAGPAKPPLRMLERFDFREETLGGEPCFRLSAKGGRQSLCLLYLHGGAYVMDIIAQQWTLPARLLSRLGGEAIVPLYPLAPEHGWQEGLGAIARVYRDLIRERGNENVVIIGDSAGGGLALTLAQQLRDAGGPLPAGLILFSPWLDIGVNGNDQPALQKRDPALTIEFLRAAGKLWAKGLAEDDPRISPLFGAHHGLPPIMVFSGTRDILDSDALRLARLNPGVKLRQYRNMFHVWPCSPIPEATQAIDEAVSFIECSLNIRPQLT